MGHPKIELALGYLTIVITLDSQRHLRGPNRISTVDTDSEVKDRDPTYPPYYIWYTSGRHEQQFQDVFLNPKFFFGCLV